MEDIRAHTQEELVVVLIALKRKEILNSPEPSSVDLQNNPSLVMLKNAIHDERDKLNRYLDE